VRGRITGALNRLVSEPPTSREGLLSNPAFFEGKRALVTGASKRLGRETALSLADRGAHLAIHYHHSQDPAEALCQEIRGRGVEAVAIRGDLHDPEVPETLFEEAWRSLGGVDLLVNNASIFPSGRLEEMTLPDLLTNLRINSWAPFLLTRALWLRLRGTGRHASVVNLLDTRLVGTDLAHAPYHLSKALLAELTTMTALEFAPELQVNGVAPGAVLPPEELDEDYLGTLTAELPLRRRGYPSDITDATLYLLEASFVTGQILFVDGGRHIRMGGTT
jgi:NAD(P)-dependent dehydrogenase (short-subunit alcohol dehydrogenase family)